MSKVPKFYKCYQCGKTFPIKLIRKVRVVESPKDESGVPSYWCLKCMSECGNAQLEDDALDMYSDLPNSLKDLLNSGKARIIK